MFLFDKRLYIEIGKVIYSIGKTMTIAIGAGVIALFLASCFYGLFMLFLPTPLAIFASGAMVICCGIGWSNYYLDRKQEEREKEYKERDGMYDRREKRK